MSPEEYAKLKKEFVATSDMVKKEVFGFLENLAKGDEGSHMRSSGVIIGLARVLVDLTVSSASLSPSPSKYVAAVMESVLDLFYNRMFPSTEGGSTTLPEDMN